ncbi:TauD/TfdA family dioxygenase [Streptomyces sp. NBC_01558]|uniref:guanitoxin biosynthesis L-enduracididine beta-hydroxylase GntD n=1 Tax=Streptomyces sp. NBC_01558 TaxID=2975878 RepID=UPI002DD91A30|nr:guanitoxin biosynthesis L-enduracididine beta-hydroxylase GntD [Streptomyces sp. NBC_01558]WSD75755.1 TauD/TfdA family dioxygenase [Streptomyces sp. NBC_01558]
MAGPDMYHGIPLEYGLSAAETEQIQEALARFREGALSPAHPAFYDEHWDAALHLPTGLRTFLEQFRRTEPAAALVIHGFPVDDEAVGPTPAHWEDVPVQGAVLDQELFLAMVGTALGDPFTFSTLQLGRVTQNLLPIRGDELRQSGHGSECLLEFHTEDGFHPGRCDYLLLFGMRNNERVPTIVSSVRDVKISDETADLLRSPRFLIRPDDEHVRQLQARHPDHPALARMLRMQSDPEPVAVLSGEHDRPYLRIDYPFMTCAGEDSTAQEALDELMEELERVQLDVVVEQGSLAVVDNYVAVHGRRAFRATHDGTDRWLKRMIVSRDLRKTTPHASPGNARILF